MDSKRIEAAAKALLRTTCEYMGDPYPDRGVSDLEIMLAKAALQAADEAAPKCGEWLPISTAPKDGTKIIAAYFYEGNSRPYNMYMTYCDGSDWWSFTSNHEHRWEPTHWMPLPDAPESTPKEKNMALTKAVTDIASNPKEAVYVANEDDLLYGVAKGSEMSGRAIKDASGPTITVSPDNADELVELMKEVRADIGILDVPIGPPPGNITVNREELDGVRDLMDDIECRSVVDDDAENHARKALATISKMLGDK